MGSDLIYASAYSLDLTAVVASSPSAARFYKQNWSSCLQLYYST